MEQHCVAAPDTFGGARPSRDLNTWNALQVLPLLELAKLIKTDQVLTSAEINKRLPNLQRRHNHVGSPTSHGCRMGRLG